LLNRDESSLAWDCVRSRRGVLWGEVRFGDLCFTDEGDEDIAIALSMMVQPAEFGCNLGEQAMTEVAITV
jgi:hypothetical protein